MSEFQVSKHVSIPAALTLAGYTLTSCAALGFGPSVERCFSESLEPLPSNPGYNIPEDYPAYPSTLGMSPTEIDNTIDRYDRKVQKYNEAYEESNLLLDPPDLLIPVEYGIAEGDPLQSAPEVAEAAVASVVRISIGDSHGTGFAVDSPSGEQLIVTAAHVVEDERLGSITITSADGSETHPAEGCYVHEDEGEVTESEIADYDIAVLRLEKSLGLSSLKLAVETPPRGTWVTFVNYQGYSEPGSPEDYSGLITASEPWDGLEFLTGTRDLPEEATVNDFNRTHFVGGGSGGPILDKHGNVIGVSTSGLLDGYYTDGSESDVLFPGANFPPDGTFQPISGNGMPVDVIETIITVDLETTE